jgi:hypothetical protein
VTTLPQPDAVLLALPDRIQRVAIFLAGRNPRRLFLPAPPARHRLKAPAAPRGQHCARNTRTHRGDGRRRGAPFCRPLAREGGQATKPPRPPQADLILSLAEAGKQRRSGMLAYQRVRACRGPGPHGPLRVNSRSGERRRLARGVIGFCRGLGWDTCGISSSRKHKDPGPPRDNPPPT